jgi:hypothetical protein
VSQPHAANIAVARMDPETNTMCILEILMGLGAFTHKRKRKKEIQEN